MRTHGRVCTRSNTRVNHTEPCAYTSVAYRQPSTLPRSSQRDPHKYGARQVLSFTRIDLRRLTKDVQGACTEDPLIHPLLCRKSAS